MKLPIYVNILGNSPEDQLTIAYSLTGLLRQHGFNATYVPSIDDHNIRPDHSFIVSVVNNPLNGHCVTDHQNFNIWVEFNSASTKIHDIQFEYTGTRVDDVKGKFCHIHCIVNKITDTTCKEIEQELLNPALYQVAC